MKRVCQKKKKKKKKKLNEKRLKRLNARLECHMIGPHALPHEVTAFIYTSHGPVRCAWFLFYFIFYDHVIIWNILNVLLLKQYIVGFMMIEGIVLELDVERIEL